MRDPQVMLRTHDAHDTRVEETTAAQSFPAILTFTDVGRCWVFCIVVSTHCDVGSKSLACAPGFLRQHFLKQDAVFFDLLVYSE